MNYLLLYLFLPFAENAGPATDVGNQIYLSINCPNAQYHASVARNISVNLHCKKVDIRVIWKVN